MSLIPMKIPTGFAVCFNKFHDIEPITSKENDGFIENWVIPQIGNLLIDLGWYPDGNIDGQYTLVMAKVQEDCGWDILKEKVSRDRFEIRDTIEQWMQNLVGR